MSHLTLTDSELSDLIFTIISPNKLSSLIRFLESAPGTIFESDHSGFLGSKRIGYKDYSVKLIEVSHKQGSVTESVIQIWRPSRLFGNMENRRVIKLLTQAAWRRYGPEGQVKDVWSSQGHPLNLGGEITWRFESTIFYEPESDGQNRPGIRPKNDFIIFKFSRKFD